MDNFHDHFSQVESILLVIAHPDDESMFFAPLLQHAVDTGRHVSVLCLSTGDYDGLGEQRSLELVAACSLLGIPEDAVQVLDRPRLRDGMREEWPEEEVAHVVLERLLRDPPHMIATFDQYGVSGHPNHIAVCHGVQRATALFCRHPRHASSSLTPSLPSGAPVEQDRGQGEEKVGIEDSFDASLSSVPLLPASSRPLLGVMLQSTNLCRKFLGPLDILLSLLLQVVEQRLGTGHVRAEGGSGSLVVVNSRPWRVWGAMAAHHSQFVWYRRFFICCSRFTFVNSFKIFHQGERHGFA